MKIKLNKSFYKKESITNAKERFKNLLKVEAKEKNDFFEIEIQGAEKEARDFLNHCLTG